MSNEKVDKEVQMFLETEQQKALLQGQVMKMADRCWDLCIDRPKEKLDYKCETCLTNCVERFIDSTFVITSRFQNMLKKSLNQ